MRRPHGMKVTGSYLGEVWTGSVGKEREPSAQPIQRCMAERPEVSSDHSTGKGNVPEGEYERNGKGRTTGVLRVRGE
jgi:hypothetical protein